MRSSDNPDGQPKVWVAPVAPGYNPILLYGGTTCVPRNGGETMRRLYEGNLASSPDAWLLISWNEIAENSHIVPLTRHGQLYLDTIKGVIRASR